MSTIYSALNVPTATSHVALQIVQWTADGQLCLTTKSSAYIMTPDHGINFDTDSIIRPLLNAKEKDAGTTVGWFRTMIQFDKVVPFKWPQYSQGWATLSLGLMDLTLCAVAFSPTELSSEAGCVGATLSSNMDLHLWAPVKNYLKGEWKMASVLPSLLSPYLFTQFLPEGTNGDSVAQVLKAQIVSIAWSQQCDFGYAPSPMVNGSLLIAGNRAGSLLFLRQKVELASVLDVSDTWITQVSVTPWYTAEQGRGVSWLAYGTADGSIGAVKLTQEVSQKRHPPSSQSFEFVEYEISLVAEKLPHPVYQIDGAGMTALQWVHSAIHHDIVVHCMPGRVYLHYPSVPLSASSMTYLSWSTHIVRLKSQHTSTASSALHPPSGITYLHAHDMLLLTLSDGSINVLQGLSSYNPHLVEELEGNVSSQSLSASARSVFVAVEHGEVDKHDMNKITGMTRYDSDNGVFVWSHEVNRPGDFSYKHDAKQKAVLLVATLWNPPSGEDALLSKLRTTLEGTKAASGQSSLKILRPFLFALRDEKKLGVSHEQVLDVLKSDIPSSDNVATVMNTELSSSKWKGKGREGVVQAVSESMRKGFRQSVARHFFGWDTVTNWRLRLGLADYVWNLSDNPESQAACGVVAQDMLTRITGHIFQTLVKYVSAVSPFLATADVPFARRLSAVVQNLLGKTASLDLINEMQQIAEVVKAIETDGIAEEACPACGAEVPVKDIRKAVCANGHLWTRCSVTTFILSTAFVRTCVGCKRKAFLAPSAMSNMNDGSEGKLDYLPIVAKSWIVGELLEAARRCLFCGNGFVCIV
ncbi:putative zinc-finger of transcription factor IIIC complex domain containing protein [Amanita muscaria]